MTQQTARTEAPGQLDDAAGAALVESVRHLLNDFDRINKALEAAGIAPPQSEFEQLMAAK